MLSVSDEEGQTDVASFVTSRYDLVKAESSERLARSRKRREQYRAPGEEAVGADSEEDVRVGFAHSTAMRLVGRLVGEKPQSRAVPRQETKQERWRAEAIEKILAGIYRFSDAAVQFQTAGWHASVLGAGVWKIDWDFKGNMATFRAVKPEDVMVRFVGGNSGAIEYAIQKSERTKDSVGAMFELDPDGLVSDYADGSGKHDMVVVRDYWDEQNHYIVGGGMALHSSPNIFGFVPFELVRNVGPSEYAWGFSDQEFYESLSEYYDNLVSQHAGVIKRFANSPILGKKLGLSAQEIKRIFQEGGVITTNKDDAELSVIQQGGSPPELDRQALRVGELIHEMSFTRSTGGTNVSGTALAELEEPQEALMALKSQNWEAAQIQLNRRLLQAVEKLGSGKMEFRGELEDGLRSRSFYLKLDASADIPSREEILQRAYNDPVNLRLNDEEILDKYWPQDINYRSLIDGDHDTRIVWPTRSAKADPQYQMMLLNRFAQGALSLRTFLEETGIEDVEGELERIKDEASDMPWLRPQMAEIMANMQKGMASGDQQMPGGAPMMGGGGGMDVFGRELNGSSNTTKKQGAPDGIFGGGQ